MKLKTLAMTTTLIVSLNVTSAHANPSDLMPSWDCLLQQLSGGGKGNDPLMCSGGGKGNDPVMRSGGGKGNDPASRSGGGKGNDPA